MAELSNQEKFEKMLALDKKTFETLSSIGLFLNDPKKKNSPVYASVQAKYNDLLKRYNARQDDYRNNTLYKLGNSIQEYSDKTVQWFKDTWNSMFGIGALPLLVPVAVAAGTAITVSVVAYFIYKYFSETSTDYNEAFKTIELVSKENPELAEKMLKELTGVKKQENSTGFFNQIGQGVKTGIIVVVSTGALIGIYKLAKSQNWIK